MEAARIFGGRLFEAVFRGEVGTAYRRSLDEADRVGKGLRLRLRFGDNTALSGLPWELLYSEGLGDFGVLSARRPLVRYTMLPGPIRPLAVVPPLRILVIVSNPYPEDGFDVERERDVLSGALDVLVAQGQVELQFVEKTTIAELQATLRRTEVHSLYFIGPVGYDERSQTEALVFGEQGQPSYVSADTLGILLSDHHPLRLVVLQASEVAPTGFGHPSMGVAQGLIRRRVASCSRNAVRDDRRGDGRFCPRVLRGRSRWRSGGRRLRRGRKAVFVLRNDVQWAAPALHMRVPDGVLFDLPGTASASTRPDIIETDRGFARERLSELEAELDPLRTCMSVEDIAAIHRTSRLPDRADTLTTLKGRFITISGDVAAALAQETGLNRRDALTAVFLQLQLLHRDLDREATIVRGPPSLYQEYAEWFAPIALQWSDIVARHIESLEAEVERLQEIPSPYVVGVPLRGEQSVFIGRSDISSRIESILLHRPAPSLLLYGQRRMGKTSLLNNLGRSISSSIVPLFVDLQGPPGQADSHGGLLYHLADAMAGSDAAPRT